MVGDRDAANVAPDDAAKLSMARGLWGILLKAMGEQDFHDASKGAV